MARRQRPWLVFLLGALCGVAVCTFQLRIGTPATDISSSGCSPADLRPPPPPPTRQLIAHAGAAPAQRPKVLAVVGIQTGFTTDHSNPKYDYTARRAALRASWVPPDAAALDELQRRSGIVVRFVIGRSDDPAAEQAFAVEEAAHGGVLRLPIVEGYQSLPAKTVAFLRAATQLWDAEYIVKVDDDVYFRLDRLPHVVQQWHSVDAGYVGCMKTGQVIKSPRYRWFEPQHALLGSQYFTHAWGSCYVLSGAVAADLAAAREGSLRHFANEDVTVGSWMLALNVSHLDDRRLCEANCSDSSLAVYDIFFYFSDRKPDPAWEEEAVRRIALHRRAVALGAAKAELDTAMPL